MLIVTRKFSNRYDEKLITTRVIKAWDQCFGRLENFHSWRYSVREGPEQLDLTLKLTLL